MKLSKFDKKLFNDSEIKKMYDALEPEFQIIKALIEARYQMEITQQDFINNRN